jgi:hypothetical protein
MKNYPEYPDGDDVDIKDLAEACGETDFARASRIVGLIRELRMYDIQSHVFVRQAVKRYLPEVTR